MPQVFAEWAVQKIIGYSAAAAWKVWAVYLLAYAAATTAIYYVTAAVMKPKMPFGSLRDQGLQVNMRDAAGSRRIVYGTRKLSGVLYPVGTSGSAKEFLHLILIIAGHECDELGDVYFNDEIVPLDGGGLATGKYAGFARVKKHVGTYDQVRDSDLKDDLGAAYWGDNHTLSGIAYLYIRLKLSQDLFPGGIPEFWCMVKGRKVYDQRDGGHSATNYSTWTWSDNAALCLQDWLRGVPMPKAAIVATAIKAGMILTIESAGTTDFTLIGAANSNVGTSFTATGAGSGTGTAIPLVRNYGLTASDAEIDSAAVQEAANICDEDVDRNTIAATAILAGSTYTIKTAGINPQFTTFGAVNNNVGTFFVATAAGSGTGTVTIAGELTEKRYTANGMLSTGTLAGDGIDVFRTAMAGDCVYVGGVWIVRAGAYRTPTVTLTDDDLRAPISGIVIKPSRRELINGVKGVFLSPENNWQPADFPPVVNSLYLTQDAGERLWADVELQMTTSSATAQRLAKIMLEDSRQPISFTAKCKLTALRIQTTDVVNVTNSRLGWAAKPFKVMGWTFAVENDANGQPYLGCDVMLKETASAIYDWSAEETAVDLAPNTLLPDGAVVATPTGLALLSDDTTSYQQADGTVVPRVRATWTLIPDAAVQAGRMWVEYSSDAGLTPLTAGSFVTSTSYTIKTVGTTDFTLIGATANTVGIIFVATGAGSGTGTATVQSWLIWSNVGGTVTTEFITDVQSGAMVAVRIRGENAFTVRGLYNTVTGHVVAVKTFVDDPSNLVINGRFSDGDFGWPIKENGWVIENNAGEVGWGARKSAGTIGALRNGRRISCSPGDLFILRGRALGTDAVIRVAWYDASSEISTSDSNVGLSIAGGVFDDVAVEAVAPVGAVWCRGEAVATTSGSKVDNVSLYRRNQINLLGPVSLDPGGQQFTTTVTVTATHGDAGATIRYTTNGTPVTGASQAFPGGGLTLTSTTTLRVAAYKTGYQSAETIQSYTIDTVTAQVAAPSLTWTGTRGATAIVITATCATSGAAIKYQVNGGSEVAYATPYSLALGSYIEFYATKAAHLTSAISYLDNSWDRDGGGISP